MNITELTKAMHSKIAVTANSEQTLIISKAIERLKLGTVKTVDTYTDLFLENPQIGEVYFVNDENKLYYGIGAAWVLITATPDISAWAWGLATNGRLGDGSTIDRSSPVSVVGGFSDWIQISAGGAHNLGLRANGSAWAWGLNDLGRFGNNSSTARSSPVSVVGGFSDWVQVSAGGAHSVGLRAGGSAWAWGSNANGRLGDHSTTNRSSPVSVVGGFLDWVQVSAGNEHSIGLRAGGSAWAWGNNGSGRLGDGTITDRSSPVSVIGGFQDWVQISAGGAHSAALRAGGSAWSWGRNLYGQLGDNSNTNRSSPVSVIGGFDDWVQISAGTYHTIALRANGSAWAWGSNANGRLGDHSTTNRSSPVSVVGGFSDWVHISPGYAHTIALRANGSAWAWGSNSFGELGDGSTTDKSSPVSVVGGFLDWVQISAGGNHTTAIRSVK